MGQRRRLGAALSVAVMLVVPAAASARDANVTSFDGTQIVTSFFPADGLKPGQKAATVLVGHGFGQSRDGDSSTSSDSLGSVGTAALLKAGFNVLTWDARGFGASGGQVSVDGPQTEGRDVQALIDYVAKQPEAELDKPGDPRLGMSGASYGGGIQLVAAGLDSRIDAIVPDIAWHSLLTSLYKDNDFKFGWGNALVAAGLPAAQAQGEGFDSHITSAFAQGEATGQLSQDNVDWFGSRGPGDDLVGKIKIPTLLTQGTADTLFTLRESRENFAQISGNGNPTKMIWFCGGHGVCLTKSQPAGQIEDAAIDWFKRWLDGDTKVDLGAGFTWTDQAGGVHSSASYPPPAATPITASGAPGTLPLVPGAASGLAIAASAAVTPTTLAIPAPKAATQLVGEPSLSLTYSGTAAPGQSFAYAQIVDQDSNLVLGNQVTPIPLTLDGQSHTIDRSLEGIAYAASPSSKLVLQLIPSTSVYGPQRSAGAVTFSSAKLSIPTVDEARAKAQLAAGQSSAKPATASSGGGSTTGTAEKAKAKVTLGVPGSRKSHRAKRLTISVRTTQPLRSIRISLSRGGKLVARVTATKLTSSRKLTLKMKRTLRSASYRLSASYVTTAGAKGTTARTRRIG